MKRTITK